MAEIPNETLSCTKDSADVKQRILQAKNWLKENPSEPITAAVRIFHIEDKYNTLKSSLLREKKTSFRIG